MSDFKGKKGPWSWVGGVLCNESYIVGRFESPPSSEDKALIAAAPELLEALQEIREEMKAFRHVANEVGINDADGIYLGHTKEIFDKASAAIAKALGQ